MKDNASSKGNHNEQKNENPFHSQDKSSLLNSSARIKEATSNNDNIPFIITNLEQDDNSKYESTKEAIDDTLPHENEQTENDPSVLMMINKNDTPEIKSKDNPSKRMSFEKEIGNESLPPSKSTSKHHKAILIFIILVLLLPIIVYGLKVYNETKAQKRQEFLDLAVLCEENYNIKDYQTFLEKYPESLHKDSIKQRMTELKDMATNWDQIKNSTNKKDFINFRKKYNDKYYNRLCYLKLDSMDWNTARQTNTPDGYQNYINKNPNGFYMSEAIIAKGEVGYVNLTENEINNIRLVCSQFFSAIQARNIDSISLLLAPEIEEFMQLQSPSLDEVCLWMNENKNNEITKATMITDSIQSQRTFNPERGISYISNLNIAKTSTENKGKENKNTLIATVKQNGKFQIFSITVKNQ